MTHAPTDVTLMTWARDNGYVVFTHDLDFGALLVTTRAGGPSVLQVRTDDTSPAAIGADVLRVLHIRAELLAKGALVTIDKVRARVRVLPIGAGTDPADESRHTRTHPGRTGGDPRAWRAVVDSVSLEQLPLGYAGRFEDPSLQEVQALHATLSCTE